MKFKFLSFLMAIAVALAFTSCKDNSKSSSNESGSGSGDKDKTELTGDPAKDARMAVDEMIEYINNVEIKTEADLEKYEKGIQEIQDKYEKYYKDKGEDAYKKFQEADEKLKDDPEVSKKIEEAMGKMMMEAMKVSGGQE